jgi:pimeloyl-ACP methyl ester carboxylesterase
MRVPGSDLYYEDDGEGLPILLIHAGGATASTWGRAVDDLAEVGRVITYDRRGMSGQAATRPTRLRRTPRTPPSCSMRSELRR